jgi:hypothetical protein
MQRDGLNQIWPRYMGWHNCVLTRTLHAARRDRTFMRLSAHAAAEQGSAASSSKRTFSSGRTPPTSPLNATWRHVIAALGRFDTVLVLCVNDDQAACDQSRAPSISAAMIAGAFTTGV